MWITLGITICLTSAQTYEHAIHKMQTRVYQFYATTFQANAANRQILNNGVIVGVTWACALNSVTDDQELGAELSFQAASGLTTDNAQGIIDAVEIYANVLTSGIYNGSVCKSCFGIVIPVQIGQLVYLNTAGAGANKTKALMYVLES
jgi:hypothetical protein